MSPSLARRERAALCDLALDVGPDAPTLCGGWDTTDLVTHLLVRERRPLGAAGIVISPMSGLTDRAMARYRRRDFTDLVHTLRSPGPTPYALPPIEKAVNTMEYVVHHEDLRRAQPGWQPRELDPADVDEIWSQVRSAAVLLGRQLPVPVVLRRADTRDTITARKGADPVVVTGPVLELALLLFGRAAVVDLTYDGPPDRVAELQG